MEGKGVRTPAMEPNATDSPVDESPEVDATGHEATGRKRPDLVLDRGGARNRLPRYRNGGPEPRGATRETRTRRARKSLEGGNSEATSPSLPEREGPLFRKEGGSRRSWSRNRCPPPTPRSHTGRTGGETRRSVEPTAQVLAHQGRGRTDLPAREGRAEPGKEGTPACVARGTRARSMPGLPRPATSGAGSQPQEPLPRQGRTRCAEPVVCEDHTRMRADPRWKVKPGGNSRPPGRMRKHGLLDHDPHGGPGNRTFGVIEGRAARRETRSCIWNQCGRTSCPTPTVVRPWWRRRESAERQEGSDRSDAERLPTRRILRGEVRIAGKSARVRAFGTGGRAAETR
jgi:hypothetical protein